METKEEILQICISKLKIIGKYLKVNVSENCREKKTAIEW